MTTNGSVNFSLNFTGDPITDLFLVSTDAVHFAVHRKILEASSSILKHAFEDGQLYEDDQTPRIYLAESKDVVETLLTYCYPFLMPRLELSFPESWDNIIRPAHKYQVGPALEAINAALRLKTESPSIAEHDLQAVVFASQCGFHDLEVSATRRLLDEEPSTEEILCWIKRIEAHSPVEVQPKVILLLHQHQERAQLLRTRLGQRLASSLTNFNHAPPDASHLCDCTFVGSIWKLWEQSRNFNSVSQLEGFVKRANAELESLEGIANGRQKESLKEAGKVFKELLEGVRELSEALVGA
ncbi:hypothetical protein BCR35DRAFT_333123 [Leucosporidium creatinivorum]|uniref:BTB domain-containing protein n=1 Tax=Leucosporidium creatinivorum TaxID=106004 RepID=A0A1Y2EVN4_9BASI|nr:hypothetical protein BCR35DRAFT_333123 [Leucosporidium creatinivorum]